MYKNEQSMITEDYVSFEIAKLLKEKGFDSENVSEFGGFYVDYYHNGQFPGIATESMMLNKTLSYWEYLRPTLQMAMKWLREKHKLSIEPYYDIVLSWVVDIKHIGKYTNSEEFEGVRSKSYDSYEEACEAAIKYCLENLI